MSTDTLSTLSILSKLSVQTLDRMFRSMEIYSAIHTRIPIALRLDGVRFGRALADIEFRSRAVHEALVDAARAVMEELGCCCSYIVSDEINVLCLDYIAYGGRVEKLISISASIASAIVSTALGRRLFFDSRVINLQSDLDASRYILYRARVGLNNFISELYHRITKSKHTPPLETMVRELKSLGIDINRIELWKIVGSSVIKKPRVRASGKRGWVYEARPGFLDAILCVIPRLVLG